MREAIRGYLEIQTTLAKDELEHVGHMAQALSIQAKAAVGEAGSDEERELAGSLLEAASDLAEQKEPDAMRESFGRLSVLLVEHWRESGDSTSLGAYIAYCPMVKKRWIQEGRTIRNPYAPYMPLCGSIED